MPMGKKRVGVSAYRRVGVSAYRRIGVSAYRRIGVSAYRRIGVLAFGVRRLAGVRAGHSGPSRIPRFYLRRQVLHSDT